DRRRLIRRELVDGRILRNERIDIGDGDEHLRGTGWQLVGDLELIEIARRVVIDRGPEQVAQIGRVRSGGRRFWCAVDAGELPGGRRGHVYREPVLAHDLPGGRGQIYAGRQGEMHVDFRL